MIEIHASTLPYYTDCPRRALIKIFKKLIESAGYILNTQNFHNISGNIGTACHSGAQVLLEEHDQGQALSASRDKLSDLSQKPVKYDGISPNINTAQEQTGRIVKCFDINIAANVESCIVEKRLETRINDEFILSGKPDFRFAKQIHDLKTGKNLNCQAQVGAYSLNAKAHGLDIDSVIVDSIKNVRLNKPVECNSFSYNLKVCENLAKSVIRMIMSDYEKLTAGTLPPCNNNSMLCSKKWCSAFGTDYCEVTQ